MKNIIPIMLGERFIRPEAPDTVWVIENLVKLPGLPTHAKLVAENRPYKMMTISEVALRDQKFYHKLEDPNPLPERMTGRGEPKAPPKATRRLFGIDFDAFSGIGPLTSR